jgi:putative transposase
MPSDTPPKRQSTRLPEYDYTAPGAYFVTVCVQHHLSLLGALDNGIIVPTAAGAMILRIWQRIPSKFPTASLDVLAVMPNHLHGIILLNDQPPPAPQSVGADPCVCPHAGRTHRFAPTKLGGQGHPSLGRIVQWFKTITTNAYIRGVRECAWPPFPGRLWQRNYHDRVIRNERELRAVRQYIHDNPARWPDDPENPNATRRGGPSCLPV